MIITRSGKDFVLDFDSRLADWAEKAVKRNGIVEYISAYNYKTFADTKQLARVESGWLLKEIIERFYQKVNSTLQPDRKLWLYSAHNLNLATMLNSLGMFEVLFFFKI